MSETSKRSIVKGLTWRTLATADTVLLAFIFTGNVTAALSIGGLELVTKTVLYYIHERAWLKIPLLWMEEDPEEVSHQYDDYHHIRHRRISLFKAVSWRFFGAIDTMILSLIVTGDLTASAAIGGTEVFTKIFLYYMHERGWTRVKWGLK